MDLQTIYQSAKDSWQPEPTDNLDNAWFYSAWSGFSAVCTALGHKAMDYNHIGHQSICHSRGDWSLLVASARAMLPELPKKPEQRCYYDWEPEYNPNRPYEIFKAQFKAKYPDQRINSKFAKDKWLSVQAKAVEFAQAEHADAVKAYQAKVATRDAEYQAQLAKWSDACEQVNRIRAFIGQLV